MFGFTVVLLKLFALVSLKLSESIFYKTFNNIHALFGWFVSNLASLTMKIYRGFAKHGVVNREMDNDSKKLGIVVMTRFPIPERACIREKCNDQLHTSFANPSLFERIIAESTVNSLVSWISNGIQSTKASYHISPSLLLVYKKNYTSAYSLSGWFNILPHNDLGKIKHDGPFQRRVNRNDNLSALTDRTARLNEIISLARHNITRAHSWEDPDTYCVNGRVHMRKKPTNSPHQFSEFIAHCKLQHLQKFKYLTVEGAGHSQLLEIALRAAQRDSSDYVIVLNPRAIGLTSNLLDTTLNLLQNDSVDIVLGMSKSCKLSSSGDRRSSNPANGLYLLGLRAGRRLTCAAKALASNVEWSSLATATQFWNNVTRTSAMNWNIVCLREKLEEIMEPTDLLSLESHIGLPADHILKDTITVIIPMGPGHPEDGLDLDEDEEYINVQSSKNLRTTLELVVHNASGNREIQVTIISSERLDTIKSHFGSPSSIQQDAERFLDIRLRPMITISMHYYNPMLAGDQEFENKYPKRGELIRYATEHLATGSMLVFMEPGVQLPVNWDSAVFHTLMRPGVGMGCFSYRLQLQEKYVYRKSLTWAFNSYLANWLVNQQTYRFEIPFTGQPHFIYAYYLASIGGYPRSSRLLHCIDLSLNCHRSLGTVAMTYGRTCAAGVPAEFALRHGALRTSLYTSLISAARYLGATESQLNQALLSDWQTEQTVHANATRYRLPLIQPHYLDGY